MSWAEAKWVVDSLVNKTGQAPGDMRVFTAFAKSSNSIGIRFLEPSDTYVGGNLVSPVFGVIICMSDTGYPQLPSEGTVVIDNGELGRYETEELVINNLEEGKTYYFTAFPYSATGVFNMSLNAANTTSSFPANGEVATVTIDINDDKLFTGAVITCVNESSPALTQTKVATAGNRVVSFVVPDGDTYHIKYGAVESYSQPERTESKVAAMSVTSHYSAEYRCFFAIIDVVFNEGATVTCSNGGVIFMAEDDSGWWVFEVNTPGTWVVSSELDGEVVSAEVVITEDGQSESVNLTPVEIYGIERDITSSSPDWARTDMAVGKTATASVGTVAGHSDFDTCYPFREIKRVTFTTGDVMVRIPKFYYQRYREGNIEHIRIASRAVAGFKLHPAFYFDEVERDDVYIGAYRTSGDGLTLASVSGVKWKTDDTFTDLLENHGSKGDGWSNEMIQLRWAIQMLFLVEFATFDSQSAVGLGISQAGTTSILTTGTSDTVPNLTGTPTTDGKSDAVWRGIEGLWGGGISKLTGCLYKEGSLFFSNSIRIANKSSKTADYTQVVQSLPATGYIKELWCDDGEYDYALIPFASGGSETTFLCDNFKLSTSTSNLYFSTGGMYSDKGAVYSDD